MTRAVLAVSPEGCLRGERVAILGSVSPVGHGCQWLVRGMPWQVGAAWMRCRAFAGSVRCVELRRPAALVGIAGAHGGLLCGLCGGSPEGDVDSWLAAHPLTPPWLDRTAV